MDHEHDKPRERAKPGPRPGQADISLYNPAYCDLVIEWGAEGKSLAWMASKIEVEKSTVLKWAEVHPQFKTALARARDKAQAHWEDLGQQNLLTMGFNGSVWARNMASRFRDDWTEVKTVNQTNEDGPNKAKAAEQDNRRVRELLERLGPALASSGPGAEASDAGEEEFPALRKGN